MSEAIKKLAENYAHDYRDQAMSEDELRVHLTSFAVEIIAAIGKRINAIEL